jgi:hypothetical protein
MEKLNDQVESLRRIDLIDIQTEFKLDIIEVKEFINKLESKVEKAEDELKAYKEKIINPLSDKVLTLAVKLGVWSVVAGFIGSGLMGLVFYTIKEHIIKPAITGGH